MNYRVLFLVAVLSVLLYAAVAEQVTTGSAECITGSRAAPTIFWRYTTPRCNFKILVAQNNRNVTVVDLPGSTMNNYCGADLLALIPQVIDSFCGQVAFIGKGLP